MSLLEKDATSSSSLDVAALANGVRDAESRGVLDLKGRKLATCPLTAEDAAAIFANLDADDGLAEYVADPRKRANLAKVLVVDLSHNELTIPPDARVLGALGPSLAEVKLSRNKLCALPLGSLGALSILLVSTELVIYARSDDQDPTRDLCLYMWGRACNQ